MDEPIWSVIVLAAVAVVVIVGVLLLRRNSDRRHVAASDWASEHDWKYTAKHPSLTRDWVHVPHGTRGEATDVLETEFEGLPALSFTYKSSYGSGETRSTTVRHLIAVELPAPLPVLELLPADKANKMLERTFDGHVVEFDSEAFDAEWEAMAEDEEFARDFLTARMMERLLEKDIHPAMFISVGGRHVFARFSGEQELERIEPTLRVLRDIVALIPPHLLAESGDNADT